MADTHGLGPCAARREGSTPFLGTFVVIPAKTGIYTNNLGLDPGSAHSRVHRTLSSPG